ncbi:MAG: HTTM domain-containing protein [Planctomycetota bacterium]
MKADPTTDPVAYDVDETFSGDCVAMNQGQSGSQILPSVSLSGHNRCEPVDWLFTKIAPDSLGLFRVLFGLVLLFQAQYLLPVPTWQYRPTYTALEFLQDRPENFLLCISLLSISACCVMIGWLTKAAAGLYGLAFTYCFLLDVSYYNNHYYLIALLCGFFTFVESEAWFSVRNLRESNRSATIPRWNVAVFQLQFMIVYFYGGLVKLNSDWLSGYPAIDWIGSSPLVSGLGLPPAQAGLFVAYFGTVFDLSLPFLLLFRRTRLVAFALCFAFHLTNTQLFEIGVFPWLGIAALVLFLPPGKIQSLGSRKQKDFDKERVSDEGVSPKKRSTQRLILGLLSAYFVFQALFPFRHYLYAGHVEWNECGKNFSWRMMLSDKRMFVGMRLIDSDTGQVWEVDQGGMADPNRRGQVGFASLAGQIVFVPSKLLNGDQMRGIGVWGNPVLLQRYAAQVARDARAIGIDHPQIAVDAVCSLNGRPLQYLVTPDVDLASFEKQAFGTPSYVVPLRERGPAERVFLNDNRSLQEATMEFLSGSKPR